MTATGPTVSRLVADEPVQARLQRQVRAGLAEQPKRLPTACLYDARGSELFEAITEQPEYYPTGAEMQILERVADELLTELAPAELVELGSGSSRKTRRLLEAMGDHGGKRYVPVDVCEAAVQQAGEALAAVYPWLSVHGLVADFHAGLASLPRTGGRLVAVLGSTIGNMEPGGQAELLRIAGELLTGDDALLVGVDLVKDPAVIEAAYDDAAGVTAAFEHNALTVVNREFEADLPADAFVYTSRYNAELMRVEMGLRATRPVAARLPTLDRVLELAEGEELRTEVSYKFTREGFEALLAQTGLALSRWETDDRGWYALALARPTR
jgi:L-histidine N-alpha-methyltransferase